MSAITRVTKRYDNAVKMADDLLAGVDDSGGLGFLVCDNESDYTALAAELQRRVRFPIVGGTSPSSPAFHRNVEVGASLAVITGDRARFGLSVTAPLYSGEPDEIIADAYVAASANLGETPKMILVTLPIIHDLAIDLYLPKLFELAGKMPVFGGMVSDDYKRESFAVIADGRAHIDRASIVAIGGDITPVFASGCEVTVLSDYAPTVTDAEGYVVRAVDDMSFCDYMNRLGFDIAERGFLSEWPLAFRVRDDDRDDKPKTNDLISVDLKERSGRFAKKPRVGSRLSPASLNRENIASSADSCVAELFDKIKHSMGRGCEFEAVMCVAGVGRYYAVTGARNPDLDAVRLRLSERLALFGYYGFYELCPTPDSDGVPQNRDHSMGLVACAF